MGEKDAVSEQKGDRKVRSRCTRKDLQSDNRTGTKENDRGRRKGTHLCTRT